MGGGQIELRRIESVGEFERLAAAWDGLVASLHRPTPFLHSAWLLPWWERCGAGQTMHVEAAFAGGELVGGIPLELERRRGLRVARFMGRDHSALADVLAVPRRADEIVPSLVERLRRCGADYVDLFGLAGNGLLADALAHADATLIERVEAPVLDLRPGWDEVYCSKTSSRRRSLHRRRRRQLEELGGLEVLVLREEEELAEALGDLFRIHDLRWHGRPDRSGFTTRLGKPFNEEVLRRFARLGMARVVLLRIDGNPVAFQYFFLFERRMFFYRLAFDPALARYSPGLVATLEAIRVAAEEGAERVEFLGGGERYKLELADRTEPLYTCIGLASSLQGRLVSTVARLATDARIRLKHSERVQRAYAAWSRRAGPGREARAS